MCPLVKYSCVVCVVKSPRINLNLIFSIAPERLTMNEWEKIFVRQEQLRGSMTKFKNGVAPPSRAGDFSSAFSSRKPVTKPSSRSQQLLPALSRKLCNF